jgi:hypothetical protein
LALALRTLGLICNLAAGATDLVIGAVWVFWEPAAIAGAASMEMAISAAEICFNMVVSLSLFDHEVDRSEWPGLSIMGMTLSGGR